MLITPTQIQVTLDRQQDLVATVVRDRLITAVIPLALPVTVRPAGRIPTSLRQAVTAVVAAWVALSAIG